MNEPSPLQKLADALAARAADAALAALVAQLREPAELEAARKLLLASSPRPASALKALEAARSRLRGERQAQWNLDTRRQRLRLRFRRQGAAAALLPPAFLAQVLAAFRNAGLAIAPGLEKRPRPLLLFAHPLPLGTEGLEECLEVTLAEAPGGDPLPALNREAPEGLLFWACEALPDHAAPAQDLCRSAEWRWPCAPARQAELAPRVDAFLAAASFTIEKTGKAEGRKQVKQVEVRPLVAAMDWDGEGLRIDMVLQPGHALHPAKLLAGILGCDSADIHGLVRTRLRLAEDPRLQQEDRYAPKLRNMFEDAVLLKAGPNLRIIEDDDDEPLRLG